MQKKIIVDNMIFFIFSTPFWGLINIYADWIGMKFIDYECEEYGLDRLGFVRELVKLGMMAWKVNEKKENYEPF